jgi:arylsulfatase A-like enzyme
MVDVPDDGAAAGPERLRRLFANGYHPDRSPDFEVQYRAYYLDRRSAGTTHGSPYAYDTWVPMIIAAPGVSPREEPTPALTADLAPTLAGILGLDPPTDLDGEDRSDQVGGR